MRARARSGRCLSCGAAGRQSSQPVKLTLRSVTRSGDGPAASCPYPAIGRASLPAGRAEAALPARPRARARCAAGAACLGGCRCDWLRACPRAGQAVLAVALPAAGRQAADLPDGRRRGFRQSGRRYCPYCYRRCYRYSADRAAGARRPGCAAARASAVAKFARRPAPLGPRVQEPGAAAATAPFASAGPAASVARAGDDPAAASEEAAAAVGPARRGPAARDLAVEGLIPAAAGPAAAGAGLAALAVATACPAADAVLAAAGPAAADAGPAAADAGLAAPVPAARGL